MFLVHSREESNGEDGWQVAQRGLTVGEKGPNHVIPNPIRFLDGVRDLLYSYF